MKDCCYCGRSVVIQQPLDYCDGCGKPYILCDQSHTNEITAVACRLCRTPLRRAKKKMIEDYEPRFLIENKRSKGLYMSKGITRDPIAVQGAKLVGANEYLLVFTDKSSHGYRNVYLIQPHADSDPIALHSLIPEQNHFSGSAVATNEYLFLGAREHLFRVSCSLNSLETPQAAVEIKRYDVASEDIFYLSEDCLLLYSRTGKNSIPSVSVHRVSNPTSGIDQLEEKWESAEVYESTVLLTQGHQLSFLQIDPESHKFTKRRDVSLSLSWQLKERPCIVEDKLYMVVSEEEERIFLKWDLDEEGSPIKDQPDLILKDRRLINVYTLKESYLLLFDNVLFAKDVQFDHELYRLNFGREIVPLNSPPAICGKIVAVTLKNPLVGNTYLAVLNGKTGNYIMSTENFKRVFRDPIQSGRYLFVLAQPLDDSMIGVYGFDLKEGTE